MTDVLPPPRPQRVTMIKGLVPALPERGKVKIGRLGQQRTSKGGGTYQQPEKLDHFLITTMDRGPDGNFLLNVELHKRFGEKPRSIPIRLLYDDPTLNFPTRYAAYKGRTLWCSGDGEQARRLNDKGIHETVACPCGRQDPAYKGPEKCKMNGSLGLLIDGAGGLGGVWRLRTTSYNSILGMHSTMSFLRSITGGPLANIPLNLTVRPKQATDPDGKPQMIYIVGLEYDGDEESLRALAHKIALHRAEARLSIEHIEDEARRQLMPPTDKPLPGDESEDVVAEFYPEQDTPAAPPPERPKPADFASAETPQKQKNWQKFHDAAIEAIGKCTTKAEMDVLHERLNPHLPGYYASDKDRAGFFEVVWNVKYQEVSAAEPEVSLFDWASLIALDAEAAQTMPELATVRTRYAEREAEYRAFSAQKADDMEAAFQTYEKWLEGK